MRVMNAILFRFLSTPGAELSPSLPQHTRTHKIVCGTFIYVCTGIYIVDATLRLIRPNGKKVTFVVNSLIQTYIQELS